MRVEERSTVDGPTKAGESDVISRLLGISLADLLFVFIALCILLFRSSKGMMDDPGLGWHLRIADAMWEHGGFVHFEQFCYPTQGQPWITKAWLADILFRLSHLWGGLNGVAALCALVYALVLRGLYARMIGEGVHWTAAILFSYLAALGMSPAAVARPVLFTMLGLVCVCRICEHYHEGSISKEKTLWLIPLFVLWPNLHGGYLAGIVVLVVTYLTECVLSTAALDNNARCEARKRVVWLSILGIGVFVATLCNPNFFQLHLWNARILTDPFLQTHTTTEWRPPDFTAKGWYRIELFILLLPALMATSRYRPNLVSLALIVAWLHFGLTSARYSPLWVVVVTPTVARLFCDVSYVRWVAKRFVGLWSEDIRAWMTRSDLSPMWKASLLFSVALLFLSPWLGNIAHHDQGNIPSRGLDHLLDIYRGEKVFHSMDWGGYLTWKGWDLHPRLQTFIDDRTDVHGTEITKEYFTIMSAAAGWESKLEKHGVDLLCLPGDSPLANQLEQHGRWTRLYRDDSVVIYRRQDANRLAPQNAKELESTSEPLRVEYPRSWRDTFSHLPIRHP